MALKLEYTLRQILSDPALSTDSKITKVDEAISRNGDLLIEYLEDEELSLKEKTTLLKNLQILLDDLRRSLERQRVYEKAQVVDFHSPIIRKALLHVINIVMDTMSDATPDRDIAEKFKRLLWERLVGIEERLSKLNTSLEIEGDLADPL